jgi:hypothetical protein
MSLWYVGYVTHQVSQFATAVSRSLHLMNEDLDAVRRRLDAQRIPPAPVVEVGWAHHPAAWWVEPALAALAGAPGRVLHSAAGDGWLLGACERAGIDAYGVDPRPGTDGETAPGSVDVRTEPLLTHLGATQSAALGGIVLTGTVETMAPGEREQLLELITDRLSPGGTLVVHSVSPGAWSTEDLPVEADLAVGHPLRPATWEHLLAVCGFEVSVIEDPAGDSAGRDYVVAGTLVVPRVPVVPGASRASGASLASGASPVSGRLGGTADP